MGKIPHDEILWVPGNWATRSDVVQSIAINNLNQYLFAGLILMEMNTKETFEVQVLEFSEIANSEFLGEFKESNFFIRIDLKMSSYLEQKSVIKAGYALLRAGGNAILTETSRLVYTPKSWYDLNASS